MKIPNFLLHCIGEIAEIHIDEAEFIEAVKIVKRRRVMKYSAMAFAASVGIAAALWFVRTRRTAKTVGAKTVTAKAA